LTTICHTCDFTFSVDQLDTLLLWLSMLPFYGFHWCGGSRNSERLWRWVRGLQQREHMPLSSSFISSYLFSRWRLSRWVDEWRYGFNHNQRIQNNNNQLWWKL